MYDEASGSTGFRAHRDIPHYHGDTVRALFVLGAITLIVAQSTSVDLPLSTGNAVIAAAILVVAAGITNPAQTWIHWVNAVLAALGSIIFGTAVIEHYQSGLSGFNSSFFFLEALALLSLVALYFSTSTIRGLALKSENE